MLMLSYMVNFGYCLLLVLLLDVETDPEYLRIENLKFKSEILTEQIMLNLNCS